MGGYLPTILSVLGGLVGSAISSYVTIRVTMAVLVSDVRRLQVEVADLRLHKHDHAAMIQRHEGQLDLLVRLFENIISKKLGGG